MAFRPPVGALLSGLNMPECAVVMDAHGLDASTLEAILDTAGALARDQLAPLNRPGDLEGARHGPDGVKAPAGFAAAYQAIASGGWTALAASPEHGGEGMPKTLELAVYEIFHAANMALGLCPMLTVGAAEALAVHGSGWQRAKVLPSLVSGRWTGAMNLTEAQAGSDLARVAARAERDSETGRWRLYGEKIFITWGDHDAAENICHLVLARTPGAPAGIRGISLFLVSKHRLGADGSLGDLNAVRAASIEHKLGIHGSPTCVMLFDGADADLVGEEGQGLAYMFVMMNAARLQVAAQGVGIAERAYQGALDYANERRQGRSVWSGEAPALLFDHPDIRRTLMRMKAAIDAGRGLYLLAAAASEAPQDADGSARARYELLTPIAKAWCTDMGVEISSLALQIHGGMGYVEETGAAQHYRDCRIAPIYEGTNAIQALDLVGRKVRANQGIAMRTLCAEMSETAEALADIPALATSLSAAVGALEAATAWLIEADEAAAAYGASAFLSLAGDTIGGWLLARGVLDPNAAPSHRALALLFHRERLAAPAMRAQAIVLGCDEAAAVTWEALA